MAEGRFRADLYYRLNVIPLKLPPLRNRRDDIPILVDHFLKKMAAQSGTKTITKEALETLARYDWPGNVRELENVIERSVILDEEGSIDVQDLPEKIRFGSTPRGSLIIESPTMSLEELEREYILKVLDYTQWQKKRASRDPGHQRLDALPQAPGLRPGEAGRARAHPAGTGTPGLHLRSVVGRRGARARGRRRAHGHRRRVGHGHDDGRVAAGRETPGARSGTRRGERPPGAAPRRRSRRSLHAARSAAARCAAQGLTGRSGQNTNLPPPRVVVAA